LNVFCAIEPPEVMMPNEANRETRTDLMVTFTFILPPLLVDARKSGRW